MQTFAAFKKLILVLTLAVVIMPSASFAAYEYSKGAGATGAHATTVCPIDCPRNSSPDIDRGLCICRTK